MAVRGNWAIASLPLNKSWQLHLDTDERVTPELRQEIMSQAEETDINGFYIPRLMHFLERPIRHGGMSPTWHMRLFRSGYGKCEARKYDQHFYVTAGRTKQLMGFILSTMPQRPLASGRSAITAGRTPKSKSKAWAAVMAGLEESCPAAIRSRRSASWETCTTFVHGSFADFVLFLSLCTSLRIP